MKKNIILILSFLVMFVAVPAFAQEETQAVPSSGGFIDVKDSHWAKEQIEQAVAKGYVSGYPDGTFKPEQKVTRAEFIRMLVDALKLPHVEQGKPWYQPYVAAVVETGIHKEKDFSTGYDKSLTRMEMARLAVRAVDAAMQTSKDSATDKLLMYEATKKGIIHGMGKGKLAPDGHSTRAQAVAIIERILSINSGKTIPTDKYAMSAAELEYRHTNMETVLGLTKPAKLPMKLVDSPINVTVENLIVIDWEDPNALYKDMFPSLMNAHDGSTPDKDYIIAFQLTFKNDKPKQGMYDFQAKFMPGLSYLPVGIVKETEQMKSVPIVRLENKFEETYWYLMIISKEKADSFRARNALVIGLGRDGDDELWFNSL